jgi:photosystem II stability/assembly factor-like uncharacterized protein
VRPEENELRRALEARSGAASPEFRARLSEALSSRPATRNLMPAVGLATAIVLTLTSVGVLVATRHLVHTNGTVASGARLVSPSPTAPGNPGNIDLTAPATNVVWALVDFNHLYRSNDRGSHWEQRSVFAGPFRSASFIDDHEGWIVSSGTDTTDCPEGAFDIIHTTDAGATWQQSPANGIAPSQCMTGIWFFDARNGFVSGYDRNGQPAVYRTSDGGNTFAATTLPDPPFFNRRSGAASSTRANALTLRVEWMKQFGGTLYLGAFGSQDANQFVLTSTDGGASWSLVATVPSRAVVMVTESRWLDYTTPGQAMESVDGGQQFHQYASDFNLAATQFVFADTNIGYAVGSGMIQRTTDGGAHWAAVRLPGAAAPPPSPTPSPSGVELSVPSARVVWALVDGQRLFRSTDEGNTWVRRTTPPTHVKGGSPLIAFVDATTGWELVPTSGDADCKLEAAEIWRTTDGAATWKLASVTHIQAVVPPDLPADQCKDAIYFMDSLHGALVIGDPRSDLAVMFRTQDGGVTWNPEGFLRRADTRSFRVVSITSVGGTELMEAHVNFSPVRYIIGSTAAATVPTVTVPDQAVSNVAFLTATHWLIMQPGLETTDAGQTWHAFTTDYAGPADVAGVFAFAGDKVGYGAARREVYRTTDGGAHWDLIKTSWP